MRPIAIAALRAGLVDYEALRELTHWKVLILDEDEDLRPYETSAQALQGIQEALESEEQVRLQTTDLDALRVYLDPDNQLKGRLVLSTGEKQATKTVTFAIKDNKYIIPWIGEDITDMLVNGFTHLSYKELNGSSAVHRRVYFQDVEELYFGNMKAFVVCSARVDAPLPPGGGAV